MFDGTDVQPGYKELSRADGNQEGHVDMDTEDDAIAVKGVVSTLQCFGWLSLTQRFTVVWLWKNFGPIPSATPMIVDGSTELGKEKKRFEDEVEER